MGDISKHEVVFYLNKFVVFTINSLATSTVCPRRGTPASFKLINLLLENPRPRTKNADNKHKNLHSFFFFVPFSRVTTHTKVSVPLFCYVVWGFQDVVSYPAFLHILLFLSNLVCSQHRNGEGFNKMIQ